MRRVRIASSTSTQATLAKVGVQDLAWAFPKEADGGLLIVVVDADQDRGGDRRRRQGRPQPRREPARGEPAREAAALGAPDSHRLDDAGLEPCGRLLNRGNKQQLVGDLGELVDRAATVRARREVPQRLGALLAVGDPKGYLRSELADLLTPHSEPPVNRATSAWPSGSASSRCPGGCVRSRPPPWRSARRR